MGKIVLAGCNAVKLDIAGNGLISIAIEEGSAKEVLDYQGRPITDQIKNTGTLEANGGVVILDAESIGNVFQRAINLEGVVKANRVDMTDGVVKITANKDIVLNATIETTRLEVSAPLNTVTIAKTIEAAKVETLDITAHSIVTIPDVSIDAPNSLLTTHYLDVVSHSANLHIVRDGGIYIESATPSLASCDLQLALLQGDLGSVVYLATGTLTLETDGTLDTAAGVILQANTINVIAQRFGSASTPLYIDALNTNIEKITGDIDISMSQGLGTSILICGPPEGDLYIIYSTATNLTLKAKDGGITLSPNSQLTTHNLSLYASGHIIALGTIIADTLIEEGASFRVGGTMEVRYAYMNNIDNAVTYDTGNYSGTYTDAVNIIINDNAIITLTGNTTFTADSDNNGTGAFTMNAGSSIVGAFTLTINASEDSTLRTINGVKTLTVTVKGSVTVNNNITVSASNISITADSNYDGNGSFTQAAGTTIETVTSGSITINSAQTATIYNITSKGNVTISNISDINGNILLNGNISAAGTSVNLYVYANNNLTMAGNVSISGTPTSAYIYLYADYDCNAQGILTISSGSINTSANGILGLRSASNISPSAYLTGMTFSGVSIYATGNYSITIDESYTGKTKSIAFYAYGDLIVNNSISLTTTSSIELSADYNTDGIGTLTAVGSVTLNSGTSGITLRSSSDIATSTWLTGATFGSVTIYTNINYNITIDESYTGKTGTLTFYANGNLTVNNGTSLATTSSINLFADYNGDGIGSLIAAGSVTLNSGASTITLKSASDITTSTWLTGATFGGMYIYTSGTANITIDQPYTGKTQALAFYSYGNITVNDGISLGTSSYIYIQADYDSNGIGSLIAAGTVTLNSGTSNITLQSASDLTMSTWLTGATFNGLSVLTTGNASITIDQSYTSRTSALTFYVNGSITVNSGVALGTTLSINLSADYNSDGVGTLTALGSVTLNSGTSSITLRSASDITTSTWLTGATFNSLNITTTGNASITINQSYTSKTNVLYFYSNGDLTVNNGVSLGTTSSINLLADYNSDGIGA
ncbi:MAG: hypothetical protein WCT15_07175, partial [Candidatus Omnitrophota bacterium]